MKYFKIPQLALRSLQINYSCLALNGLREAQEQSIFFYSKAWVETSPF